MDRKEKKWTLEEGLEECADMEKGSKHRTEDYTAKIGTIRPCHTCGKPVDVISYGSYILDNMSITDCDEHYDDPVKPPFKKCTDDCPVHGGEHGFDEEKHYKRSQEIKKTREDIKKMLETVKPRNDSILEYDRMNELFGHSHPKMKPADYDYWMYTGFIDYFGLQGKLTLPK